MKTELDLVRKQLVALGLPFRTEPAARVPPEEILRARRSIRIETDEFLKNGLWADDMVALSIKTARVAFATAGMLAEFGIEPELIHFAEAITEMMEVARAKLDKALTVNDWDAARRASCELEVIWYGMCGSFGIPYYALLEVAHACIVAGVEIDRATIHNLLHRAGVTGPPPAANDPEGDAA